MSFPATGHTILSTGDWDWQDRPSESGADSGFEMVQASVLCRFGSHVPAQFVKGARLNRETFPDLSYIPPGEWYCDGVKFASSRYGMGKGTVRWYGLATGEGLSMADQKLSAIGAATSAKIRLLSVERDVSAQSVQFPITSAAGTVYLDSLFLPDGAPETNPVTGEYQRGTIYVQVYTRRYSGVAIGQGDFAPQAFRCLAPVIIDPDGTEINLGIGANNAAKIVRSANWWPSKKQDTTQWLLESMPFRTFRTLGGISLMTWDATFRHVPDWTFD